MYYFPNVTFQNFKIHIGIAAKKTGGYQFSSTSEEFWKSIFKAIFWSPLHSLTSWQNNHASDIVKKRFNINLDFENGGVMISQLEKHGFFIVGQNNVLPCHRRENNLKYKTEFLLHSSFPLILSNKYSVFKQFMSMFIWIVC